MKSNEDYGKQKKVEYHRMNQYLETTVRDHDTYAGHEKTKQEFIKVFTTWIHEIYQYVKTSAILDDNVKIKVLINRLRGAVRDHLLPDTDLDAPDFYKALKMVEDHYRNVYINSEANDMNAFKGKWSGKGTYYISARLAERKKIHFMWRQIAATPQLTTMMLALCQPTSQGKGCT
eukprot:3180487-Amphidinium_carterae.1